MKETKKPGSRERMVEAAITLMRASGLSGAGINEIVRESGAPKGSVYHFFPNGKQQIVTDALAVYSDRVLTFIDQALSAGRSPGEKVGSLFAAFAQRIEAADYLRSCAVGAVSVDLGAGDEELREVLEKAFLGWADVIADHLPVGDSERRHSFASFILTAVEGAYIRGRAERSSRAFHEAGRWLAEFADKQT